MTGHFLFTGFTINVNYTPILFLIGLMLWTLEEYIIHRWLFHLKPPSGYPSLIWCHFLLHGQHHKVTEVLTMLLFTPLKSV